MFSIIISEKGGAERRESFDKNEINVGRVQGNDLMLPKGNVSKHHARLLYRDGRFIVTDLKSTNGTYVNGRKIAQATIVREGDKFYIGDFVIRLEGQAGDIPPEPPPPMEDESIRTLARDQAPARPPQPQPGVPAVTLKAPTHPPGAPLPKPINAVVTAAAPMREPIREPPAAPTPVPPPNVEEDSVDYRLDEMPDDGTPAPKQAPAPPPAAPAPVRSSVAPPQEPPPRITGAVSAPERPARPHTMPLQAMPGPPPRVGAPGVRATMPPMPAPPPGAAAPAPPMRERPEPVRDRPEPPPRDPPPREPAREQTREPARDAGTIPPTGNSAQTAPPPRQQSTKEQAGRRLALQMLLGRIADAVDLAQLGKSSDVPDPLSQQLEKAAKEQSAAMREEGEAPEGIDLDMLARDAHQELVGLGIVGTLLDDDSVTEIHVPRYDQVLAVRNGVGGPADLAFSSDEALARVIMRICSQSGRPREAGETVIERRHPRGSVLAVLPPTSAGSVLTIKKRRRVDDKLDDLVRQNRLSKPMSALLEACVQGRANVLVVGANAAAGASMVAGLGGATPAGDRVAVIFDTDEVHVPQAHVVSLAVGGAGRSGAADIVHAVRRMQPVRMIATELGGGVCAAVLESIAEGAQGVIAVLNAPSLRQGVARVAAQVMLAKPGVSQEGARELVAEAFDIAIELSGDGGTRVSRIAELSGIDAKGIVLRDVFSVSAEGEFQATGVTPKIANDLIARGAKLDVGIFKRK
jgi:pilus assembly protein CpaF